VPISIAKLAEALNEELARQEIEDEWKPSGSAFGLVHRAVIGSTFVEFDYCESPNYHEVPRQWCVIFWRSAIAFEANSEAGRLGVMYCEAASPNGLAEEGDQSLGRLARFAAGCLRLAAGVELVAEGEAGQVKAE
jgi:hypothetical protein